MEKRILNKLKFDENNESKSKFEVHKDKVLKFLDEVQFRPYEKEAFKYMRNKFEASNFNECKINLPFGLGSNLLVALTPYVLGAKKVLIVASNELSAWKIYFDMCDFQMKTLFEKRQLLTETDKIKFVENGLFLKSKDKLHLSDGYHLTISHIGVFKRNQKRQKKQKKENKALKFDKFDLLIMLGCTDVDSTFNTSANCKKLFINSFWENKLNAISEEFKVESILDRLCVTEQAENIENALLILLKKEANKNFNDKVETMELSSNEYKEAKGKTNEGDCRVFIAKKWPSKQRVSQLKFNILGVQLNLNKGNLIDTHNLFSAAIAQMINRCHNSDVKLALFINDTEKILENLDPFDDLHENVKSHLNKLFVEKLSEEQKNNSAQ